MLVNIDLKKEKNLKSKALMWCLEVVKSGDYAGDVYQMQ
jgi:hypothetical protein